jgi:glycerol-3-phosphate acyltransferase PlsY
MASIFLILFGYLLGSIPTAYLAARWKKHVDLRRYGNGTVSGSMVYEHVARWLVVPVWLFDVAKAALPAWLRREPPASQGRLIRRWWRGDLGGRLALGGAITA